MAKEFFTLKFDKIHCLKFYNNIGFGPIFDHSLSLVHKVATALLLLSDEIVSYSLCLSKNLAKYPCLFFLGPDNSLNEIEIVGTLLF